MRKGHGEKLTRTMTAAVVALLNSPNVELAAAAVGIHPATLYRWLKLSHFRTAVRAAQREAYIEAIGELQHGARKAVKTLLRNVECDSKAIENDAAKAILDRATKGTETIDLAGEVAELKRMVLADRRARGLPNRMDPRRNGAHT